MDRMKYTSLDQIPLILDADCIALVLGISRAKAYQLMHADTFPTLRIGRRMVVRKEQFIAWMDKESGIITENENKKFAE